MRYRLSALAISIAMAGCATHNIQPLGTFDGEKRSIAINAGSGGLLGSIKAYLRNDGWRVVVPGNGPTVIEGTVGDTTKLEERKTVTAKYSLKTKYRQVDVNFSGEGIYNYDLSIVDNETGEEVLTMNGHGSTSGICTRMIDAIHKATR